MTYIPGGGSGGGQVSTSSDVALNNVANNEVLSYDGSLAKWTNKAIPSSNAGANALGTMNNPVTDPAAPRPTGLTYVIWDTPTDPTNWIVGDFNLQQGS